MERDQLNDLINRLVNTNDQQEVRDLYKQWATSYDMDLGEFGYVAPQVGVSLFEKVVLDKAAQIHDAGCGTGQVGQLLTKMGYKYINGSDFSDDMLAVAAGAECYQSLTQADYTKPLEIASDHFDAIISIGVYTKRFKQLFIGEMLRTLKPGGWMVFSCRPMYFEEVVETVKACHIERSIAESSVVFDNYMLEQNASAYYVSLKKSG